MRCRGWRIRCASGSRPRCADGVPSSEPPVLADVLEEHLAELDFLWELRETSIFRAGFRPLHLRRHEDRMEAHLDGLLEGGVTGAALARAALGSDAWSLVAAGAWTLLRRPTPDPGAVAQALRGAALPAAAGARHGLRHCSVSTWEAEARERLDGPADLERAVWADALAFHRREVPHGLVAAFGASGAAALRAIHWAVRLRVGPAPDRRELVASHADPAPEVRIAALCAGARWGQPEVLELLRASARQPDRARAVELRWLGALGATSDRPALEAALASPELAPAALQGLGALGDPQALPKLLEMLEVPDLSAAAAEAFEAIVGEALGRARVQDVDATMFDADEARALWRKRGGDFDPRRRWRRGRDVDALSLGEVLAELDLEGGRDACLRRCLELGTDAPDVELECFARDRRA